MTSFARSLAFVAGALFPATSFANSLLNPSPSPCSATEKGTPVTVTWTPLPGATGYEISKGGGIYPYTVIGTVGPGVTSFQDPNAVAGRILYYCVVANFSDGHSDPCCAGGGYMQTAPPSSCSLSTSGLQNTLTWGPSPDAVVYTIFRDGSVLADRQAIPPYSYTDFASPGDHTYCVQAGGSALRGSDPCCQHVTNPRTLATPNCQATQDLIGEIAVRWSAVVGATGYHITKDFYIPFTIGAGETTFVDNAVGSHRYYVQAFDDQGGSDICSATGFSVSPGGYTSLSWETCEPQTPNQNFTGQGLYHLILSGHGLPATVAGHECRIVIDYPSDYTSALPDAWRFDTGGCQGGSALHFDAVTVGGCPPLLGSNPVTSGSYTIDPTDGTADLQLSATYGDLVTDANVRYVMWRIGFDHSSSIAGVDSDPKTCDGAATPLRFSLIESQVLLGNGDHVDTAPDTDSPVTWGGPPPVRTQPTTWGRLKGMYR